MDERSTRAGSMNARVLLEEFRLPDSAVRARTLSAEPVTATELEVIRSSAFEAGYASGWEDAGKASTEQKFRIDAEFERCVQDLGFTFHEAVTQLRGELGTLMLAVTDQFIPEILPDLVRATIREEILKLGDSTLHPVVELVASPNTVEIFEDILPETTQMEIRVVAEPSLGPNQAFLRFADQEIAVDFEPLLKTLREQLAAFTKQALPEVADG